MSEPSRTADGEVWYTRRGKRRPDRKRQDAPGGTPAAPPGTSDTEGAARERTKVNPPAKSARRRREGPGEGDQLPEVREDQGDEGVPW